MLKRVLFSASLHVSAFLVLLWISHTGRESGLPEKKKSYLQVSLKSPRTPPSKVPSPKLERSKQVVRSEAPLSKDLAEDAYLGDANRKAKEPTIALKQEAIEPSQSRKSKPQPQQQAAEMQKAEGSDVSRLGDLGFIPQGLGQAGWHLFKKPSNSFSLQQNQDGQGEGGEGEDVSPDAAPKELPLHEYVRGVKEGEVTALSTREFVFYSYFEHIRKRLEVSWNGILKQYFTTALAKGRYLSSHHDYVTKTLITLDHRGRIIRVQVVEESGIRDLDHTAVEAFNKAGPFPNPPRGLMDANGRVQFHWDFILRT